MQGQVAVTAQRDQVLLRIIPRLTAKFLVMNLEVLQAPAGLTSPSIAFALAGSALMNKSRS